MQTVIVQVVQMYAMQSCFEQEASSVSPCSTPIAYAMTRLTATWFIFNTATARGNLVVFARATRKDLCVSAFALAFDLI